jgi:hypothetical protein
MNCCGNKRKEWQNEIKSSKRQETIKEGSYSLIADKPDRVFEYTGNYSLIMKGVASGKSYNFKSKGDKIKVDFNDSFAMMAERDLKVLPKESKDEQVM